MRLSQQLKVIDNTQTAIDLLAAHTGLSKAKLKDALAKGAVQLRRQNNTRRLRKAQFALRAGDQLSLHYNDQLLTLTPPTLTPVEDRQGYSVWDKPAGLMSQGTDFGDHMALLRIVEQYFNCKRPVFLIHRLDRETRGLVLIAHTKSIAQALSQQLQAHQITKRYRAIVKGEAPAQMTISKTLDGKHAITHIKRIAYDPHSDQSQIDILLETGRKHQIRRHLDAIGHPVIGDPRYGQDNKNREGLMLTAYRLDLQCPVTQTPSTFQLRT